MEEGRNLWDPPGSKAGYSSHCNDILVEKKGKLQKSWTEIYNWKWGLGRRGWELACYGDDEFLVVGFLVLPAGATGAGGCVGCGDVARCPTGLLNALLAAGV